MRNIVIEMMGFNNFNGFFNCLGEREIGVWETRHKVSAQKENLHNEFILLAQETACKIFPLNILKF